MTTLLCILSLLTPAYILEINVYDFETKEPIKNTRIEIWSNDELMSEGYTADDGYYKWTSEDPDHYATSIKVCHQQYFGHQSEVNLFPGHGGPHHISDHYLTRNDQFPIPGTLVNTQIGDYLDSLAYYEMLLEDNPELDFVGYIPKSNDTSFIEIQETLKKHSNIKTRTLNVDKFKRRFNNPTGEFYMKRRKKLRLARTQKTCSVRR